MSDLHLTALKRAVTEMCALSCGAMIILAPLAIAAKQLHFMTPSTRHIELNLPAPFATHPTVVMHETPPAIVDPKDMDCLAENIFHEARNRDTRSRTLVGVVTLVRVKKQAWPDDVCSVVYQPSQFSWTGTDVQKVRDNKLEYQAMFQSRLLAYQLLAGKYNAMLSSNVDHFHTTAVHPSWSRHYAVRDISQDIIFYASSHR